MIFTNLPTKAVVFGLVLAMHTLSLLGGESPLPHPSTPFSSASSSSISLPSHALLSLLPSPPAYPSAELKGDEFEFLLTIIQEFTSLIPAAIQEDSAHQPTKPNQERLRAFARNPIMTKLRHLIAEKERQENINFRYMKDMECEQTSTIVFNLKQEWMWAQKKMGIPDAQQLPISLIRPERNVDSQLVATSSALSLDRLLINPKSPELQQPCSLRFLLCHEAAHLGNQDAVLCRLYRLNASRNEVELFKKFNETRADESAYRALGCYLCIRSVIHNSQLPLTDPDLQRLGHLSQKDVESIADELRRTHELCPTHQPPPVHQKQGKTECWHCLQ